MKKRAISLYHIPAPEALLNRLVLFSCILLFGLGPQAIANETNEFTWDSGLTGPFSTSPAQAGPALLPKLRSNSRRTRCKMLDDCISNTSVHLLHALKLIGIEAQ